MRVTRPFRQAFRNPDDTPQTIAVSKSLRQLRRLQKNPLHRTDRATMSTIKALKETAEKEGQAHLFEDWDILSHDQQQELLDDLKEIDFARTNKAFSETIQTTSTKERKIEPVRDVTQLKETKPEKIASWKAIGVNLICQRKVAVLILAGGQGTRLGSNRPKGCYDVGLPSKKSLFQLHSERIKGVQLLAERLKPGTRVPSIPLFIMTSVHTHQETEAFLEGHDYFGLVPSSVHLFQQGMMPCLTEEGKIIKETASKIAKSPDGNGGVYAALHRSGCLSKMTSIGIECVDCFSVDNLLAKAADPIFLGHCWDSGSPCGARVITKAFPEERVGVFATNEGRVEVVEYSDLTQEMAERRDEATDQPLFTWSNICMHYFTTEFLKRTATTIALPFHLARKKIPSHGKTVDGIKLEQFIFDIFPLAEKISLVKAEREEQYAPVKNAPGSPTDSADTARALLMNLHRKWIRTAGAFISDDIPFEISPLLSYEGENLEERYSGRRFSEPGSIYLNETS